MTDKAPLRPYASSAYPPGPWPSSFWRENFAPLPVFAPLDGPRDVDVLVVGAGFTGLNAALELGRQKAGEIAVVDAGQPGWGASGRNGGFCCLGGTSLSLDAQIARFGWEDTKAYLDIQRAAIARVGEFLDNTGTSAERHSDGELELAHKPRLFRKIEEDARLRQALSGITYEAVPAAELAERGMGCAGFFGGVITKAGFALNPMAYLSALLGKVQKSGASLFGETRMTAIREEGERVHVATNRGLIRAKKVILGTNGYGSDDVPAGLAGRFLPVISAIMVTRPLSTGELAAQGWHNDHMAYDSRHLLHYFRKLPDGRFLIGQRGALSVGPRGEAQARARARADFEAMFPAWAHVETAFFWSGFICVTRDLTQYVGPVPGLENTFAAFGYHGNGVSMASISGAFAAQMALGDCPALPGQMTRLPRRFPLGVYRRHLLRPAFWNFRLKDRFGV